MGHRPRAVALVVIAAAAWAGCGDAIIVTGDAPGLVRIAIGVPDTPGDSIGATAIESRLTTPLGLAADETGMVYIADSQNSRILGVTSAGVVNVFVSHQRRTEEPRIREPDGLTLDGQGNLYFADPLGNRLWRLDLEEVRATPIAGTGVAGDSSDGTEALAADLDSPAGIAIGPNGRIYFSETGKHRIRRIEADGTLATFAGTGEPGRSGDGGPASEATFFRPVGLAFGPGALYITDTGNHKIRRVDLSTAVIITIAGTGTRGFSGDGESSIRARMDSPRALAFSNDGFSVFIADTGNNRIRLLNLNTNTIVTLAGTGTTEFIGDLLPAAQTALDGPRGVAISALDILFIADTGHHLVRRTPVAFLASQ